MAQPAPHLSGRLCSVCLSRQSLFPLLVVPLHSVIPRALTSYAPENSVEGSHRLKAAASTDVGNTPRSPLQQTHRLLNPHPVAALQKSRSHYPFEQLGKITGLIPEIRCHPVKSKRLAVPSAKILLYFALQKYTICIFCTVIAMRFFHNSILLTKNVDVSGQKLT